MEENIKSEVLTERGIRIYDAILNHCKDKNLNLDIDQYQLVMLAQAFDLYYQLASFIRDNGITTKPASGGWIQLSPEYSAMQKEYAKVLRLSKNYGLSPLEREKIFKNAMRVKNKATPTDGLD